LARRAAIFASDSPASRAETSSSLPGFATSSFGLSFFAFLRFFCERGFWDFLPPERPLGLVAAGPVSPRNLLTAPWIAWSDA
jgi:hypothetical protein